MSDQMIRLLLGQGAFGIVAALFVWLYVYEKSEHKASREKHTTTVTQHTAQLKETYERLAREKAELVEQLNELREEHAQQQRALHEQLNDLREAHAARERACLQTVEYFAKAEVEAVEELGRIAQALRKAHDRLRR